MSNAPLMPGREKKNEGKRKRKMTIRELTLEPFSFNYEQLKEHDFMKWNDSTFKHGFPYEYFFYKNKGLYRPWEDFSFIREQMTKESADIIQQLEVLFSNRQKDEIKPYMLKGIVLYISLLYWSNQLPVDLSCFPESLKNLKDKPVNVEERLPFIIARPYFYPSFMQLKSLMEEQIKIAAKKAALNKYLK